MKLIIEENDTEREISILGEEKEVLSLYEVLGQEICNKFNYDYEKLLLMMMYRSKKS